ncbi:MAG TPA: LuxR C-terminal-related transcriptional regulator, partial [Propionibacteriaceae bacterium]|nr:LuxR C-terminal-related transcriptional regulator [Propionibacteriaceae bacterium]
AEKTVKNYVSALLMKLNMASRTQAAVFGSQFHRAPDGGPSKST